MNSNNHTMLFWTALIIGLVWSAYSSAADLFAQVDCLRETLYTCGNTWLIRSVI